MSFDTCELDGNTGDGAGWSMKMQPVIARHRNNDARIGA
jgi:hypothetical protein